MNNRRGDGGDRKARLTAESSPSKLGSESRSRVACTDHKRSAPTRWEIAPVAAEERLRMVATGSKLSGLWICKVKYEPTAKELWKVC